MEDAVPQRVELKVLERVDRIPAAQHVVPLQQLVQDDAVEEATKPQAEKDPRRFGEVALRGLHALLLFEKNLSPRLNRLLHRLPELMQQPEQRDLEAHVIVCDVNIARCSLPECPYPKVHPVAGPFLLLDRQHWEAFGRFAKGRLDPAKGRIPAELVRDGDDEGFGHSGPLRYGEPRVKPRPRGPRSVMPALQSGTFT